MTRGNTADDGSEFSLDINTSGRPAYWSQRTLQEDKKRCLTEMPHNDHTISNTLEFLHEDKKHHSNRAITERKRLHQPMRNDTWRRRPSTPTHAFAASVGDKKLYWSHNDLVEAKRKMGAFNKSAPTTGVFGKVHQPQSARETDSAREGSYYETRVPDSARERRRESADENARPYTARSPNGGSLLSYRSVSEAGSRLSVRSLDRGPAGAHSPTVAEIIHHQGADAEEHPHNASALGWWETVREVRDTAKPHRSFQNFDIKKRHHMTEIHDAPTTKTARSHYTEAFDGSPKVVLFQRDPKGTAVQGDYPHVATNEAWGPPRGDETPPSRYHSCEHLALDKGRHATPLDGGRKDEQCRMVDNFPGGGYSVSRCGGYSQASPGMNSAKSDRRQYRSNFTMQQHKKKHLAQLAHPGNHGGGSAGGRDGTPGVPSTMGTRLLTTPHKTCSLDGRGPGCPTPCLPTHKGGTGFSSHRELQYCKRFNTVEVKPCQQLHDNDVADRPWPKPGDKQRYDDGDRSQVASSTPPCPPAGSARDDLTTMGRGHHRLAITKYSPKSGCRLSLDSSASDGNLLHSSQQELAERKATCSTSVRHAGRATPTPRETPRFRSTASESDLALRRDSYRDSDDILNSHRQLDYSKTIHKFGHDDPRRTRPTPRPVPVAPTPRTGQWTPAHV